MDEDGSDSFNVHHAPDGKFYMTRRDQPICPQTGLLAHFEVEREALEFLAEIGDIGLH